MFMQSCNCYSFHHLTCAFCYGVFLLKGKLLVNVGHTDSKLLHCMLLLIQLFVQS